MVQIYRYKQQLSIQPTFIIVARNTYYILYTITTTNIKHVVRNTYYILYTITRILLHYAALTSYNNWKSKSVISTKRHMTLPSLHRFAMMRYDPSPDKTNFNDEVCT